MIREEIRDDADPHFTGKTDAQILRELYGLRSRRGIVLNEELPEHPNKMAAISDDETESQIH
jgi:hypothetical protein